jgi:hypothetical protein
MRESSCPRSYPEASGLSPPLDIVVPLSSLRAVREGRNSTASSRTYGGAGSAESSGLPRGRRPRRGESRAAQEARFFEERVPDVLLRLDADLRFADCSAADEAATRSRAAVTRLISASARLPAALAAFFAVPPSALAASTTCSAAPLAELFSCDSLRLAEARLRVAAAFFALACRWAFVCGAIAAPLFGWRKAERRSIAWRSEGGLGIPPGRIAPVEPPLH